MFLLDLRDRPTTEVGPPRATAALRRTPRRRGRQPSPSGCAPPLPRRPRSCWAVGPDRGMSPGDRRRRAEVRQRRRVTGPPTGGGPHRLTGLGLASADGVEHPPRGAFAAGQSPLVQDDVLAGRASRVRRRASLELLWGVPGPVLTSASTRSGCAGPVGPGGVSGEPLVGDVRIVLEGSGRLDLVDPRQAGTPSRPAPRRAGHPTRRSPARVVK